MDEERVRVLNMLKEGKINPEEALKILEAMETVPDKDTEMPQTKAKWLRVRVTDLKSEKAKVSVNLPMGLVDWALRAGTRFASLGGVDLNGMGVDAEGLRAAISSGLKGKIVDVIDDEDGQHVEVILE